MGSSENAKVGELENITREERTKRLRKEVMGCVQSVVGKKNLLVKFEDGQKKEIGYSSLVFFISKEEAEMDEPISHLTENE